MLTRAINWALITQQYDQMIKYARALQLGTAGSRPTMSTSTAETSP